MRPATLATHPSVDIGDVATTCICARTPLTGVDRSSHDQQSKDMVTDRIIRINGRAIISGTLSACQRSVVASLGNSPKKYRVHCFRPATSYHFRKFFALARKFLSMSSGGIPNLENILTLKWRKYACRPNSVPTTTRREA